MPSPQVRPAYTTATVATGVYLDVTGKVCPQFPRTAVESSASQVVDPLPPAKEFPGPVCNQVHRERVSASELPENIADIPVVQKQVVVQVIVQAIPRVAGTLPPIAEFTVPAYNPVHQEQFSAGDTSENFANIPVVQDQLFVQAIPRVVGSLPPVQEFTAYVARRPSPLAEVWPSERAQRHFMEDLGELAPSVQLLDLPVPQMVENVTDTLLRILDFPIAEQVIDRGAARRLQILDSPEPQMLAQLLEVFRLLDTQLPDEQAIDVPKIFRSPCPSRSRVPEPQLADQLVEVPTVLTPTRIALQIAERIVDTPVSRGQVKTAKKELRERRQEMLDELVVLQRNFLPSERTPSIERRIAQLVSALEASASSKPPKRKRKKRRKKRLPRSPRPLLRVRAHRRLRQWLVPGWFFIAALGQGWHALCGTLTGAWFDGSENCGAPAVPVHRRSSTSSSFRRGRSLWSCLFSRPQRFLSCRSFSCGR